MRKQTRNLAKFTKNVPADQRDAVSGLILAIRKSLPKGFTESISERSVCWSVSHGLYPDGYHCDPSQPLPFLSLALQKNHIALYHMGLYASPQLLGWFKAEWPKHSDRKLDMGKSCIRFRRAADAPAGLIAELAEKMTPFDWIALYDRLIPKGRTGRR